MTRSSPQRRCSIEPNVALGLKPKRLAADTAYGTGRFLGWLVGRGIAPHIPVRDASERDDGTFSRSEVRWDKRRGVTLSKQQSTAHHRHRARWQHAPLPRLQIRLRCVCAEELCCPNMAARQVPRDVHEDARDMARRLMGTKRFLKSRDERKRVEMRFAHLKTHHGFERMRLRGLSGARDEFHLAAIVQNLKTMALRLLGPPTGQVCASIA
ncbi:transposase [Bradyrhizobium murdochi]|uniref:transposase n=1 Tax=Bradyrhizobium murdochi TaxID=1038859 RepID=UPI003D315217